jgi:hypothetical protein
VDHFLFDAICDEESSEVIIQTLPFCKTTYYFLLERPKGISAPVKFLMAEAAPAFKRNPGAALGAAIREKWAEGFYPARVVTDYQILLAHTDDNTDLGPEPLEVQVVKSTFMNRALECAPFWVFQTCDSLNEHGFLCELSL